MGQDIVADGLNQIMNIRRVEKREVLIRRYSKVLLNLFEMMKERGHIDYVVNEEEKTVTVTIKKINLCRAVKPRYNVDVAGIDRYLRRFLPSRKFGTLVISTNKGLMDSKESVKQNLGGSIIAYFY
ncbi:30S ribosomal protein S8 [archaeon]|jgi:small subunit ribosomal protein S8|nr:30S ribosomal protein S8 [archaeon]MBT6182783.1 30S ribosomal protein S8 [archaeon]MBT6606127.1 30S ribosomal protein S8 [archaeon]MBT7252033.1 30S ribosomal protein S8 [archaeon]MBT7661018.1 30S ribosomal protein S8 [archaeon]